MNLNRYLRQTSLPDFGESAQRKLKASRVLVVGLGGLGIPVVEYLNAMGVGTLGLVDQDVIALSNLQRQPLYTEEEIGRPKLEIAIRKLRARNAETSFEAFDTFLVRENALQIISNFDLVIDASDNFPTRYLINDACVLLKKPFVSGAIHGFEGQLSVFNYHGGPTYRCLFPNIPGPNEIPDCETNGVLGVIPGIIGTLQALEVVKILSGIGEPLSGKLLIFNGLNQTFRNITFKPVPENLVLTELPEIPGGPDCLSPPVSWARLQTLIQQEHTPQIIDVRTAVEFMKNPLPDALNIPLHTLENRYHEIDFEREIYCVCQTGKRSSIAVSYLKDRMPGSQVYQVAGGIGEFKIA